MAQPQEYDQGQQQMQYDQGQMGQQQPIGMGQQPMMGQQTGIMGMLDAPVGQLVLGKEPTMTTCPFCQQQVVTNVTFEMGCCAYVSILYCLCFPCICDCFKDVHHSCSNCHRMIGSTKRC